MPMWADPLVRQTADYRAFRWVKSQSVVRFDLTCTAPAPCTTSPIAVNSREMKPRAVSFYYEKSPKPPGPASTTFSSVKKTCL